MQVSVQELTPLAEWKLRHFDEGMGVIEMDSYNASVNKKGQRIDRQFPFGGKKALLWFCGYQWYCTFRFYIYLGGAVQ